MYEEMKKLMETKPTFIMGKFTEEEWRIALQLVGLPDGEKQLEFDFEGKEDAEI